MADAELGKEGGGGGGGINGVDCAFLGLPTRRRLVVVVVAVGFLHEKDIRPKLQ